jgi:dihydrofolate reductase
VRKIIVLSFITLDGVMQAPGAPEEDTSGGFQYGGWTFPLFDETAGKWMNEQLSQNFDALLGRKTYDIFAAYWPKPENKDNWPGINQATKYVVSHQELNLTWENSILINEDVVEKIIEIKNMEGPDIQVHGSGELIQLLLKHTLVDELWLKIFPVTLGTGKRLFGAGTRPASFKLNESKVSPRGVIFANYELAGDVETGSY